MRKIHIFLATALAATMLSGCGGDEIRLISDEFEVSVGDEISTEIKDYVRMSASAIEQMELDMSEVDTDTIGIYKASITYNDKTESFNIVVTDKTAPVLTLVNDKIYLENSGRIIVDDIVESVDDFSEFTYGFSDSLTKSDSTKEMLDILEFSGLGDYNCEVIARDEYGNCSVEAFTVHVVEEGKIPIGEMGITDFSPFMNTEVSDINSPDSYSAEGVYYGVGNSFDEESNRPELSYYINKYGNMAVDFIQPESDFVWLTFNEIIEYGHTEKILDTLKEKEVSAVFFVTMSYVENNPEIIQRMIDEGHVIGNYTANCSNAPDLTVNELTSEIEKLYNYLYQTYGYKMYLFRPPSGYFSEQTLATAQSLGYRTVLWSFAYADWDTENQPDVDEALENAVNKAHGGAIYLLSGSSSTNEKMLADMIDGIRDKELEFAVYQQN